MSFMPRFARSLYTALRVFNRANIARGAQERKRKAPGRCGKEKEKEKAVWSKK